MGFCCYNKILSSNHWGTSLVLVHKFKRYLQHIGKKYAKEFNRYIQNDKYFELSKYANTKLNTGECKTYLSIHKYSSMMWQVGQSPGNGVWLLLEKKAGIW